MPQVKNHPINDNFLYVNNKEYTWINGQQILVGVENPEEQEIVKNEVTGLNYARNKVEGQEIYNRPKRVHHSMWFILDLETGSRGWYPGCEIHGDIYDENVEVKAEPRDDAETVEIITRTSVKVLELDAIDDEPFQPGWYKIKNLAVGYVHKEVVHNLRYEDPFQ